MWPWWVMTYWRWWKLSTDGSYHVTEVITWQKLSSDGQRSEKEWWLVTFRLWRRFFFILIWKFGSEKNHSCFLKKILRKKSGPASTLLDKFSLKKSGSASLLLGNFALKNVNMPPLMQAIWGDICKYSGEKSNKCKECDYAFSEADELRRHLQEHSGEKPNKCSRCTMS